MSLLLGHRYTHETISTLTDQVMACFARRANTSWGAEAFRQGTRAPKGLGWLGWPLPEEMAFVYLDGLFLKVFREGLGMERAVPLGRRSQRRRWGPMCFPGRNRYTGSCTWKGNGRKGGEGAR